MHKNWSSYLAFLIAVAGAAIGLGNIWKFPYMVGENGGSSFVLVYIFFVLIVGIPLMLAEMVIGKCAKSDPISSFKKLTADMPFVRKINSLSWLLIFTAISILSFYSVMSGFTLSYFYKIITGTFTNQSAESIHKIWEDFIANPTQLAAWNGLFLVMNLLVVGCGVQSGLERINKILMPTLYGILFILFFYVMHLPGFNGALDFMFGFRFHEVTADVVVASLGHAFFSLAIGAGCLLVYGSYLDKGSRIGSSVFVVALLSILVALLSGIAIYSIVFTYNLPVASGPGLMFEVLPIAFAKMPYGVFIGTLFFAMLIVAAWTSAISFIEVLVSVGVQRFSLSRRSSLAIIGLLAFMLGLGTIWSFNIFTNPIIFNRNFFYLLADGATNILLPVSGILIACFVGWLLPLERIKAQIYLGSARNYLLWRFLLRWIVPCGIILVMLNNCI